ncbi:hypothetical protein ASE30_05445, partial [Achromobacter sp. Root83]|uniref:non-ribosomal peptide synthetase n=1 Tax=Achromobacter sp. Root83 TaxID=1736602 RepID=UPI00070900EE
MTQSIAKPEEFRLSLQQLGIAAPGAESLAATVSVLVEGPAGVTQTALAGALAALTARHEILRTRYRPVAGTPFPVQQLWSALPAAWQRLDGDAHDEAVLVAAQTQIDVLAGAVVAAAYRDDGPAGIRFALAAARCSLDLRAIQDLAVACVALAGAPADQADRVAEDPLQYADYAAWQEELLESEPGREGQRYWQGRAAEAQDPPRLPFQQAPGQPATLRAALTPAQASALRQAAEQEGVPLEKLGLAWWAAFVARLDGAETVSLQWWRGERQDELAGALGNFAVRLPLTLALDAALDARALAGAVLAQTQAADSWHECFDPAAQAQWLAREGRQDAGVEFEFVPVATLPAGWRLAALRAQGTAARLRCELHASAEGVVLVWQSNGVFDGAALAAWHGQFAHWLGEAAVSDLPWSALSLLDAQTRKEVLVAGGFDTADVAMPPGDGPTTLNGLVEAQARLQPGALAVRCGESRLTYGELDARARRLASDLAAAGVGPGDRIGILIGRSALTIVAMLGVLKAGAAYVPVDPAYPAARVRYVLDDAGIRTVIVAGGNVPALPESAMQVLVLDETGGMAAAAGGAQEESGVAIAPASLAYVIYTSGSTGNPKGVQISHANAVASTLARHAFYAPEPVSAYLLLSSFSFDSSVAGIYWTLSQGGVLCIPTEDEHQDPLRIAELVKSAGVSHMLALPSFYRQLVESVAEAPLRCVIVAGEACHPDVVAEHAAHLPGAALVNEYGPTEGTVWSHASRIQPGGGDARIPIGHRVGGTTSVVLDDRLEPCPPGVTGELYIGGSGIARGYLGRAALSAERFVANPFDSGGRLYRTGDLARLRLDGALEYLGRIDNQVKIRGYRVELGEIEALLLTQPGVAEAVVVAREGRLVAYLSPALDGAAEHALKHVLEQDLPGYMVPAVMVSVAQLPHTPNGKVDRQALPDPDTLRARAYEPPRDAREEAFCAIWRDVLNVDRVGRDDNFFELGGDSILGLQIVARLRKAGWRIAPRQLFEHQTVARLAGESQAVELAVTASETEGVVLLAPIQQAFLAQAIPQPHHWNQAVLLRPREALDVVALRRALAAIVAQHDALRLRMAFDAQGRARQFYGPAADIGAMLWHRQADAAALGTLCEEAQRSLDLTQGPLMRALAVELADGGWRLLLVVHHLAVDGVSWRILLEDLQAAYEQAKAGREPVLPAKTASYKDWTRALHEQGQPSQAEREYWLGLTAVDAGTLPCAHPDGARTVGDAAVETISLDAVQTAALLKTAPAAYRTRINDVLLTALTRAVSSWTGQRHVAVDVESHGRDMDGGLDLSRTVGWFTAVYPVRLDGTGGRADALKRVKEALRAVPRHGIGHGLLCHLSDDTQRAVMATRSRPEILFNYLGQFDGAFEGGTQWLPAAEPVGASQDPAATLEHELAVSGQVLGGCLTLSLTYSAARQDGAAMRALMAGLHEELLGLIEHCVSGARGVTPSDFPLAGLDQHALDALQLPLERVQDLYPLSAMQQGMLFHSAYEAGSSAYINQLRVDIAGLDEARFEQAWQAALARHDALRAGFLPGDAPLQWIARTVAAPFTRHDWSQRTDIEAALTSLARDELAQGFDLNAPPLMRFGLVRRPDGRHHFLWTHHHLLMDGWSAAQLLGEVLRQYGGEAIAAPAGQYRDYIDWLGRHDRQASQRYWQGQAARIGEPTRVAGALTAGAGAAGQGEQRLEIDAARVRELSAWASAQHVTLNTLVQGAWARVLARCLGRDEVCFGATVAGRPDELPQSQSIVGVFINTLPVAIDMPAVMPVGDWLRTLQAQNLAAREHETVPLQDIHRLGGRDAQGYFDNIVVFENYPVDGVLRDAGSLGLRFSGLDGREETNYAVTLVVAQNGSLSLLLRHDEADVDARAAAFLLRSLEVQISLLAQDALAPLGSLALGSPDVEALLGAWQRGREADLQTTFTHHLIESQAARRGDAVALVYEGRAVSYADLNARANRLAHR